jgi:hypothetical protein
MNPGATLATTLVIFWALMFVTGADVGYSAETLVLVAVSAVLGAGTSAALMALGVAGFQRRDE